ncbi:MAG: peptide methionine sulfoxide reductase [Desulfomicrobiaceae bacterium]|jgi:peptide-methionine (S)-S-oxide reductase|nr:peptide methionine sulfoxide reductase [Desulfomicrobiaceae bacterium]
MGWMPTMLGVVVVSLAATPVGAKGLREAVFAGGCFWCVEHALQGVPGVVEVISGYSGGSVENPTYEEVSSGRTGHLEAVLVRYDPQQVDFARLVRIFGENIDPLDADGQFCDRGPQYRSAIFVADAEEEQTARQWIAETEARLGASVATLILPRTAFYPAEEYHQDFSRKNPLRYHLYRWGCGRDARLKAVWGDAPKAP